MLWVPPPQLLPFMKWGLPRADGGGGLGGDSWAGGHWGGFYPCRGRPSCPPVPSPVTVLPAARLFFSIKSQNPLSYGSSPPKAFLQITSSFPIRFPSPSSPVPATSLPILFHFIKQSKSCLLALTVCTLSKLHICCSSFDLVENGDAQLSHFAR